jgi:thiamine transporter
LLNFEEESNMKFELFEELAGISGIDLYLLIGAGVAAIALIAALVLSKGKELRKNHSMLIVAGTIYVFSFLVSYFAIMLIQSFSSLSAQFEGDSFGIGDVFSYQYTPAQFTTRLILSLVIALFACLAYLIIKSALDKGEVRKTRLNPVKMLVYGAISISLAFVLSYIKLFSMPLGGSITLFSMLPIMVFAAWAGPGYGFLAAFAYGLLQVVQGAYIIHWAQFLLDYIFAFTALGLASFFPKRTEVGILTAGVARMVFSTIAGAVFWGAADGWNSAWVYSLAYNGSTIGIDTILCLIAFVIPPVKKALGRVREQLFA